MGMSRVYDYTGTLEAIDPELNKMICSEKDRQKKTLNLIASENYTYPSVMEASGSVLTNKYSEGMVGARYYGGTQYIDEVETLCQKRALELFNLDPNVWGVNVQALSGSPANLAVYTAVVKPGGKIMGLDLPSGGHLTHGFQTKTKKISATSLFFTSHPYTIDSNGFLNYDDIEKNFMEFLPDILICGYSAYSRDMDYKRLKEISDKNNSFLLADISHISPLIASGLMNNPFKYCDLVTTTTQKGLRGPRGALIFYRKKVVKGDVTVDLETKINFAVFPMLQGGPHNHSIAAIANALYHASMPEFKKYAENVIQNSKALCNYLKSLGFKILTDGTDNHMFLVDLKPKGLNGSVVEYMCDILNISINKNSVLGDTSPLNPNGIRLGTYAMTTRGMGEQEMVKVGKIISDVVDLCKEIMKGGNLSKTDFIKLLNDNDWLSSDLVKDILKRVEDLTNEFPIPGINK